MCLYVCVDESYAQGLLVLEQCQSTQQDDNSKGLVLLGMSTLFSERYELCIIFGYVPSCNLIL